MRVKAHGLFYAKRSAPLSIPGCSASTNQLPKQRQLRVGTPRACPSPSQSACPVACASFLAAKSCAPSAGPTAACQLLHSHPCGLRARRHWRRVLPVTTRHNRRRPWPAPQIAQVKPPSDEAKRLDSQARQAARPPATDSPTTRAKRVRRTPLRPWDNGLRLRQFPPETRSEPRGGAAPASNKNDCTNREWCPEASNTPSARPRPCRPPETLTRPNNTEQLKKKATPNNRRSRKGAAPCAT